MSLFGDPESWAENPPESWRVVKVTPRHWSVVAPCGATLCDELVTVADQAETALYELGYSVEWEDGYIITKGMIEDD